MAASASSAKRTRSPSPVRLTTSNPFGDDEEKTGSYAIVSSLLSKVKQSFATPAPTSPTATAPVSEPTKPKAPPPKDVPQPKPSSSTGAKAAPLKPATRSLRPGGSNPAPPLVSFAPIAVEQPRYVAEGAYASPQPYDAAEGSYGGTTIPGFAIPDDARSVRTTTSTRRGVSVSKVIRRLRGEGLSRDYWMDDEHCKECYDCKSVFTTWRRKHHCRVCGQIFCSRCAANIISSSRFGESGMIRVCNLCLQVLQDEGYDDDDDRRSVTSAATSAPHYHPYQHHHSLSQSYPHHSHSLSQPQSPYTPFGTRQTDEPFSLFSLPDLSFRRRFGSGAVDSDDSRPHTPTDTFVNNPFGSTHAPVPAPFRRAANDDDLPIETEGMEEKDIEMYVARTGSGAATNTNGRTVGVGNGPAGKFVFPNVSKPNTPGTPGGGALHLDTGPLTQSPVPIVATLPVPTSVHPAESTIQFPASAPLSSPETPGPTIVRPLIERPRLASAGGRARLSSFGTGPGRMDSYGMGPGVRMDSFSGSYGERTPFLRSRVHSRLGEFSPVSGGEGEAGWRTRRESSAYAAELNAVSMFHLRIMVRQLLAREKIGGDEKAEWEDTLLRLSLKLASRLNVASSSSADMDVRHFVKIKKIPGGRPRDSEYVDGAVISTNLAHKKMKRHLPSPRIMILAFSLEWQRRENEYLTLDSIMTQEREYLRNLVARITALRPHLVLVEKTVSRLALEYMMDAKVAVARAVPSTSTKFVARMTGAEVVPDIPALHRGPRLGECARFRVQTFDHHLIPGRRKTFMRFEGCDSHRSGCTLILRGGDVDTLKRVKSVVRLIAFIVRNLKMESFLWKDCVVTMPSVTGDAVPTPAPVTPSAGVDEPAGVMRPRAKSFPGLGASMKMSPPNGQSGLARWIPPVLPEPADVFEDDDEEDEEEGEDAALSKRIEASLRPYLTTFISASATLRFLPPWPIRKMKEADDQLRELKREWQERERARAEDAIGDEPENVPSVIIIDAEEAPEKTVHLSTSIPSLRSIRSNQSLSQTTTIQVPTPPSRTPTPAPVSPNPATISPSPANVSPNPANISPSPVNISPSPAHALPVPPSAPTSGLIVRPPPRLHTPSELDLEARLADAQFYHEEMRRIWEWYLRKNKDDFAVEKYQQIAMRNYIIPSMQPATPSTSISSSQFDTTLRPCFRPEIVYMKYYGEGDKSLAQFIEESCTTPTNAVCAGKNCNTLRISHTRVYVHNESRVYISTEPWTGKIGAHKIPQPHFEGITTWSLCRVCMQNTPLIPLSEEAGRYSFAKFLELHFYPADVLLMHGAGCLHNIYEHHVRYFYLRGMTVRFQTEKVTLYEVVFPPNRVRVKPQALLAFKNSDYSHLLHRNTTYWDSVLKRVQFAIEAAAQMAQQNHDQAQGIANLAMDLRERSLLCRAEVEQLIHQAYSDSPITDTLQLGRVRPKWQGIITQFDDEFSRLEKMYLPSGFYAGTEKDFRRSVAQNKIAKFMPSIEMMNNMFNTMDRKMISRFVDPEKRPAVAKREVPASSASEYDSTMESGAEPPASETDARPSSIDLPSPAGPGQQLHESALVGDIPVDQIPIQALGEVKTSEDPDGDSDSTISAPQTRPATVVGDNAWHSQEATVTTEPNPKVDAESTDEKVEPTLVGTQQTDSPVQEADESTAKAMVAPQEELEPSQPVSRLPRRTKGHTSVADLVKQFQAVLPEDFATGAIAYGPLARTSLLSDSERDSEVQPQRIRGRPRAPANRSKFQAKGAYPQSSDFERPTRQLGDAGPSRIPAPIQPPADYSHSGRSSPTHSTLYVPKRPGFSRTTTGSTIKNANTLAPISSSPPVGRKVSSATSNKPTKAKATIRNPPRDRSAVRNASNVGTTRQGTRRVTVPSGGSTASKVATQVRQFERLSKESEKANRRYQIMRGRRARPVALAKAKSSDSSSEADDEDEGEEDASKFRSDTLDPIMSVPDLAEHSASAETTVPGPPSEGGQATTPETALDDLPKPRETMLPERPTETPESSLPPSPFIRPIREYQPGSANYSESEMSASVDRRSFFYRMSSAAMARIQNRDNTVMNLNYPVSPTDHVFAESYITVREDEPTSIIALTLSAHDYQVNMANALSLKQSKSADKPEAFMPDDLSVGEAPSAWGVISHDDLPDPADVLKHPQQVSHQTYSYQSGDVTVTCKVLYAEQFQALRRSCDCEQIMIESLARCTRWDASGGKSGSAFLRTRDERFLAKELSRQEADSLGKFAPLYFEYMSSALSGGRPSLLAKLFGFYQISLKNPIAGKSVKMNLLVQENLFYDRKYSRTYDLKGLTRNRMVQRTGRENEVLLDDNLVQASYTEPYYLREHTKRILRGAIWSDTQFLADLNVMDYSMLVGVDDGSKELVVGIVDFVRTFTWDKKLESMVKETLGGAGKGEGPTIVTPTLYRDRFRTAMEHYFPLVPDRWMKDQDAPDTREGEKLVQRNWPDW
ncbi:1-phosphatidylinositol-4-phosphate 5-kinase [Ceratobasidium sp. AG-Ba]|nr:1-phosphatidylinositol-4-phosphate 5-kinase [Ceratobasidium sp. AG-Ba]